MPRKKVDNRIRILVENGVALKYRSMVVVVGDRARDQVVILHHMLSKAVVKARPTVLWCYKKELGFSSHRKKRMRQLQKKLRSGTLDLKQDDPFELFVAATSIRYCYYAETHKILGNTYGMCVLQDFEAMTPNLLARTTETVEGGGLIVLLLRSMASLRQLYTLSMDVHARYRTEAHQDVVGRFNERFLLSLASCSQCMVIDDQLNILPVSSHMLHIKPVQIKERSSSSETELEALKESLADTQPVGAIVSCARTLDQAKAVLKFIEAISEKTLRNTVALTAARGRGKSAALGLAIAAAVAFGYSNIFVTSPSPENLNTLFEFVFRGFDALSYSEHEDYEAIQSTNPEFGQAVVRVNIFHEHRQTIQYIHPADCHKLGQAELVCIDEAAAIPLPLVKALLGPYLVFMASTVNGYEGTGRSLSLKLIGQLRQQSAGSQASITGRVLREVSLVDPIRYGADDPVERWLYELLCLDAGSITRVASGCPPPDTCQLYCVNRDTLFCYHRASEEFLQRLMALCVASHYKNSPNDLQLLSDAPAHRIFALLGPLDPSTTTLPEILCVLQVCLEGGISKPSVLQSLSRGKRAAGDLIPWTISQQFADHDFAGLSGVRVVRIATHPDFQGMGYGSRALQLLLEYYQGKTPSVSEGGQPVETSNGGQQEQGREGLLHETIAPRSRLPPLLAKLDERPPEHVDYIGVAYGLTAQLYRFWKRAGYIPVYIRQTAMAGMAVCSCLRRLFQSPQNELTGEHSCIMLQSLRPDDLDLSACCWLQEYHSDFRCRFLSLLSYQFRTFPPTLALSILHTPSQTLGKGEPSAASGLSWTKLEGWLSRYDLKRLLLYSRNMADHRLIMDLLPTLGRLFFTNKANLHLSALQASILLALGLQHKTVDQLQAELELPSSQVLGLFNRTIRKFVQLFTSLEEGAMGAEMATPTRIGLQPVEESVEEELSVAAKEFEKQQAKQQQQLETTDLSRYAVTGREVEWEHVLEAGVTSPNIVTVARAGKRRQHTETEQHRKHKRKKNK